MKPLMVITISDLNHHNVGYMSDKSQVEGFVYCTVKF